MNAQGIACIHAKSCLTLCNPMDCSLPGSFVHGISLGKNTECLSGLSFPPGDLSNPEIRPTFPALQADSLLLEPSEQPPRDGRERAKKILYKKFCTFKSVILEFFPTFISDEGGSEPGYFCLWLVLLILTVWEFMHITCPHGLGICE